MGRFLRSKKDRAALWYAANGKCQQCGAALPADWHGDHRIPWWKMQRTNVHEMQALCPKCNLQKGSTVGLTLRSFQVRARNLIDRILAGEIQPQEIYAPITTGAGKSTLPPLLSFLIPQYVDKICWIVPRIALAKQAERTFIDTKLRQLLGHTAGVRYADNDPDPSRGTQGYVTTYHSIRANPDMHRQEFDRFRYLLFLDEAHHVEDDFRNPDNPLLTWKHALAPLVERAALRVFASGTFERPQSPIAFLPYKRDPLGYTYDFPPEVTIRYSRSEALREGAIVPLQFLPYDGHATWMDANGNEQAFSSFDEVGADSSKMLNTVLETQYALGLIQEGVQRWRGHRSVYQLGKLLIVAPSIREAKRYHTYLTKDCGLLTGIATVEKTQEAVANIDKFKSLTPPSLDVLITVGMAYEGLDVPQISHLVCLTAYRSRPWLEQCLGRANRTDPDNGKVAGYILAPDDLEFREIAEAIIQEQLPYLTVSTSTRCFGPEPIPRRPGYSEPGYIPFKSGLTEGREIDGSTGEMLERGETGIIERAMRKVRMPPGVLSALQFKRLEEAYQEELRNSTENFSPKEPWEDEKISVSEKENILRSRIQHYCSAVDAQNGWPPKTTNDRLYGVFQKSRTVMTLEELGRVWVYLNQHYPLHKNQRSDMDQE